MKKKTNPLRKRIVYTLLLLVIYGAGKDIPLPFANADDTLSRLSTTSFWGMTSTATGGNFSVPTLFSLGLAPWMTGMIFWQLLTMTKLFGIDQLPKHISERYRNGLILVIAIFEGLGTTILLENQLVRLDPFVIFACTLIFVAGSFFLIWLININSIWGIGGASAFIVYAIVGSLAIQYQVLIQHILTEPPLFEVMFCIALMLATFFLIALAVVFELSEYRIKVERIMLNERLESSYIPLKLNSGGSMAYMFGLTMLILPQMIFQGLSNYAPDNAIILWLLENSGSTNFFGVTIYNVILFLLTFLFAYAMLDVTDIAKNLQKSGDYVPDVFPGRETELYLRKKRRAVTFIGAIFTVTVAGLPLYLGAFWPEYAMVATLPGMSIMLTSLMVNIIFQLRAIRILHDYKKLF